MLVSWMELLLAYLHDPPDKALSIRGHVTRARDAAKIAVGDHVRREEIEEAVSEADPLAAVVERLPMPSAGPEGEWTVGPENGKLQVRHPLSATSRDLKVPGLNEVQQCEQEQLQAIIDGLSGQGEEQFRNRFLAIWRLWPDTLTENCNPCFSLLPADTRIPDHTIWHHLDTAAAFKAVLSQAGGAALLAFALGPVQRFIEAARTVRDLWSGSMILSWLAFRAMLPIIERLGPTALIYPALRGNPMLDLWLGDANRLGNKIALPDIDLRKTPVLPHRFLALVPWGNHGDCAKKFADACREAAAKAWQEMAQAVRSCIKSKMSMYCPDWDKRWDDQVGSYFSTVTAVLPLGGSGDEIDRRLADLLAGKKEFREAFPDAEAVRELARAIPAAEQPGYSQDHAGRWQYQVELVQRSLAAHRNIRHIPPNRIVHVNERFPQKCTMLGSLEQMGPDDLRQSRDFWDKIASPNGLSADGVRVRQGEALCAVALVKRFAAPAFLQGQLRLSANDLRFPDTWTVAAAEWLHQAEINWREDWGVAWNGHWLHWSKPDEDPTEADPCPGELWQRIVRAREPKQFGKPPVYYAILKLDGDDLGGWLRGEKSPRVREVMHPKLLSYFEGLEAKAQAGLDAKRPVGPALHAAISTALANFALYAVPEIVRKHQGTVIYSGGDDTLVLLPVSRALPCACQLRQAYMSDYYTHNDRERLMMGGRATISGGLVVVHAKDDLRLALEDVRRAEDRAKEAGKDALCITIRRRSGEHTSAICPWSFVPTVENWASQFLKGASDRWAYHLYAERTTLADLPAEAIRAEIRRQLLRADEPTPRLLPPDDVVAAFASLQSSQRFKTNGEALLNFLTLCHAASFIARGRDG